MDAPVIQPTTFDDDFRFAERCLDGDGAAIEELRDLCRGWMRSYLVRSGAKGDESGILIETLLTDCVAATKDGGRPLLATYLGQCPLRAWLSRVALNRLISFKRAQQREQERFGTMPGDREIADFPDDRSELTEEPVLQLIRDAINCAFKECEPESLVMLQLLHTGGLHPDEIAPMFGCVSTTVTRSAERASAAIRATIVAHVRARDPWLELTFDDLLTICRTVLPDCLGVK
jgi:RNA polymerase sigma factor (sigma-70 family)